MLRFKLMNPDVLLLQRDVCDKILSNLGRQPWQVLYRVADTPESRFGMWCALLDDEAAANAMTHDSWDLMIGEGRPCFSTSWDGDKKVTNYHRYGTATGVRPLVLRRSFHGAVQDYSEIDEEFRLYHNLAESKNFGGDNQHDSLLSFDDSGRAIEVVQITRNKVQSRLKYIRQFQAERRLHLGLFVESVRFSNLPVSTLAEDQRRVTEVDGYLRWRLIVDSCDSIGEFKTLSLLRGKAIIPPPPQDMAGVSPFDQDKEEPTVSFIVGLDENGNEIEHTSDPSKLKNYFGANPDAFPDITPVYFRREVLVKYYAEPDRYTVIDGQVSCLNLWYCPIDNDLESHVVVLLSDLGQYLPHAERLHWRQFNVPPEGKGSETMNRRSFMVEAAEPKSADLVFRRDYVDLISKWEGALGWSLYLPQSPNDEYLIDTIRIPLTNSQSEFDEQIVHLTKLLVDSLNEGELATRTIKLQEGAKGISKFEEFLRETSFSQVESTVGFLRNLQSLRSAGSAHRKGSRYERVVEKAGVDLANRPQAIRTILREASRILKALEAHYCD